MKVSVIVPTYNRREVVVRTVKSLFDQDFCPDDYEIIVVVDGSIDGTASALRELTGLPAFRIIEQENKGLAGARNSGLHEACGDIILFLDDDMSCDRGLVSEHYAGHLGPEPVIGFGAVFLSPDSPLSLPAEIFKREVGAFYLRHREASETEWSEEACIFGNTSSPRLLLLEVGGFDERFRMREDAELGIRLFAEGIRPRYLPNAIAYQYYFKTAADLIRDADAFAVADHLLMQKHGSRVPDAFTGRRIRDRAWKQWAWRAVMAWPRLSEALLIPCCWAGDRFIMLPPMRRIGMRALQVRRGIHWQRRFTQLSRS
jgi:glycosyltransferase involved in cell wall biosynthesis